MRKKILILLLLVPLFFQSCSRYNEGPIFSLQSPEKRIVGTWQVEKILADDLEDQSMLEQNIGTTFTINEDNTFRIENSNELDPEYPITGTWSLSEDKIDLILLPSNTNSPNCYNISRLTSTEFWVVAHSDSKSTSEPVIEIRYYKI
jgi:hypothetical protein